MEAWRKAFAQDRPRALLLDDDEGSRAVLGRTFSQGGFEAVLCDSVERFEELWSPGMFDVIVADWDLAKYKYGDEVLISVRERDWDVPFVLISGRLDEDCRKSKVLLQLLSSSGSRFVERGDDGFEKVFKAAIELIERRDLVLLKLILKFRKEVTDGASVETSTGPLMVKTLLEEVVRNADMSYDTEEPIANRIAEKLLRS